ncbi:MAG: diacylglycerol/polyprenol kinase family protein [Promethearchaeota archaeon]
MSITSLPDDHIALCTIEDDEINYRESYTRGRRWKDPVNILTGLNSPGNLTARSIDNGIDMAILLSWDALEQAGNESTRKSFYSVYSIPGHQVIAGPSRVSSSGAPVIEYHPSCVGDGDTGYTFSWLTNQTGNTSIAIRYGNNLASLGGTHYIDAGSDDLAQPVLVRDSTYNVSIVYSYKNSSNNSILIREINDGNPTGSSAEIIGLPSLSCNVSFIDSSFNSNNDLIVSMEGCIQENSTIFNQSSLFQLANMSGSRELTTVVINNKSNLHELQHLIFTNDQVLSIWLEDNGETNDVLFTITDFDMTNRNSIVHSLLIAYVFVACGIFNIFVSLEMKEKTGKKLDMLNNMVVTVLFFTLAVLFILPYSGFYGEKLGESVVDGYVMPAPINLGMLIVLGFMFLFYLMTTPLIDKYWKGPKEKPALTLKKEDRNHFSLKREFIRKIPHMMSALFILGFVPFGAMGMKVIGFQKYDRYDFINEGAIIFDYVLRLNDIEIGGYAVKFMLTCGILFVWILDLHWLLIPNKNFFLKDFLRYALREKEEHAIADFVTMFISMLLMIIILTFNPQYKLIGSFCVFAGFCSLCFGDTIGAITGKKFGKHNLTKRSVKTWEGAIAGTVTSILLSLPFISWPFALIVGSMYLVVDLMTPKLPISDNVLIPLFISFALLPFLPYITSPLMGFFI